MAKRSRSRGAAGGADRPRGAGGRPGSPRARLFLALEPGDSDRLALAEWRDAAVAGRADLRPTPAETLHLTLAFLGYRPEKEIPLIAETGFGPLAGAAAVVLEPVAVVPVPKRRPRLFALELRDPDGAAGRIQAAVSDALAERRLYEPEKRPWWPHVTLARVKRGARAEPLDADPPAGPLRAAQVTLYRSFLRPQGALYEPQARLVLGRPDSGGREV